MSINHKPGADPARFIDGAPDSRETPEHNAQPKGGLRRGRRRQITITVHDELLATVDALAERYGISRAAAINQAMRRWADVEATDSNI